MKIGELAERSGLSTKAIRYYEDIGILPEPERASNGYRVYEPRVVDRIEFIRDAQSAGLSLVDIQMVLELRDSGEGTCDHVTTTLTEHRDNIDQQLQDLQKTRRRLTELIDRARSLDPAECTDPNRCQTIPKGTHHEH